MGKRVCLLVILISLLIAFGGSGIAIADDAATITITCSTAQTGSTDCASLSPNASTSSAVDSTVGQVNLIKLRNIENTPVVIKNGVNTKRMSLYGEIDNRGIAEDLTVDLSPRFDSKSAPTFMPKAPDAGSSIIIADSIKSLSVSVNGYAGKTGKSISELCAERAIAANKATDVASCLNQTSSGQGTGYYENPNCDSAIIAANQSIADKVSSNNNSCASPDVQKAIIDSAPPTFCPTDSFYLNGRDGLVPPVLTKTDSVGDLSSFLSNQSSESPVRLRYLNKCVQIKEFRTCDITGNVSIAVPQVSYATCISSPGNICPVGQAIRGVIGQNLTITPGLSTPQGVPILGCGLKLSDPASVLFPQSLSIDPTTCIIKGVPTAQMGATSFTVVATNLAGASLDATVRIAVDFPTFSNRQDVSASGVLDAQATPTFSTVTLHQVYDNQTDSCAQVLADHQGSSLPVKPTCATDAYQPTDCFKLTETNTAERDVSHYYGNPVLSYSSPTLSFTEGQAVLIKPTHLSFASGHTPDPGCAAVVDANSGLALPSSFTVDPVTCIISGTAPAFEVSMSSFSIVATDSTGSSSPAVITLSVSRINPVARLSFSNKPYELVANQAVKITPVLNVLQNGAQITDCRLQPNSQNADSFPVGLFINVRTCEITGVATSLMPKTAFTLIASNLVGTSNSAIVQLTVVETAQAASFTSTMAPEPIAGVCPFSASGEVFEKATQSHIVEPYASFVTVSDEYEQLDCMLGNCKGANDSYTFSSNSSVNFPIEAGESGSFGGRATVFSYDIASSTFLFENGSNGKNGSADITARPINKYCAKVIDARGLNQSGAGQQSPFLPVVNFHTALYTPFTYTLPLSAPGTAFPQRKLPQAIGIYKKVDSSVRAYIMNALINPRFQ
jgi:hypothetical protein